MRGKVSRVILSAYDLFLAIGAIYYGSKMSLGLFWAGEEWPKEWIGRVPFRSWFWPGVIAIVLFGLGNLFAAYYSIYKEKKFYLPSLVMGLIFLISLIISIPVLGESYLATGMFIILAIIQLILTLISVVNLKKKIIISVIFLVSVFIIGNYLYNPLPYNILLINKSGEELIKVEYRSENSSGSISKEKESIMKAKDSLKMNIDSNKFTLIITDSNQKEHRSEKFNLDFENNEDKVYKIVIEKDSKESFKYRLNEG